MLRKKFIKRSTRQIIAMIEKSIFLELRIKSTFINRFLEPVINLILFLFIFGIIFTANTSVSFGYWNANNYFLFLLIAFMVQFSKTITVRFGTSLAKEKYWKTLSAIMVAPVNRFTLLAGLLISELVMISIPFIILFIIALIFFPISILYIFLVLLIFSLIFLIFGGIGLILGVLNISREGWTSYVNFFLRFTFLFSCTNYPKEIFPLFFQDIVVLNPFYYVFDLLRLVWYLGIDYDVAVALISPIHIVIVVLMVVLIPLFSTYFFEKIYKKYGITGY